ncbi:MAG: ribbon-helix-helix domain-containing protein [Propionibacteriaceae bacterium]|jgi:Arc/MetJ-type ribon-helix-helix transcriptional regulator|nr:ribbon-helix-helix domain-containing protein [Propionibacteriaceae bacterium]
MRLSVSLPERDVVFLDEYASRTDLESRSAVLRRAIEELRDEVLKADYLAAFSEWDESGEAVLWDVVSGDGLGDAPR